MRPSHASTPTVAATAGRPIAQRRRVRRLAVVALVTVGLMGLAAEQAQADPIWGRATPATFADGVPNATPLASFGDVSCASPGNCTAVGNFLNADEPDAHVEAFAQTQTDGRWGPATPVLDDAADQTQSMLVQVSCASAGNCTAVGTITHTDGSTELLAVTQTDGTWERAVLIAFPLGSTYPAVTSMSCASADNCTAVGYYGTPGDEVASFAVTQADGAWGALQPTTFVADPLPLPAGHYVRLASVSCASAGNCTAAGTYGVGGGGRNTAVFTQTQVDGDWGLAEPVMLPGSGVDYTQDGAWPTSISCATAASCTLVGTLRNGSGAQYPFIRTRTDGDWGPVALPAFAGGYEYGGGTLNAVSCSAAGECTAVGDATLDGHRRSFAVTRTGGSWGDAELASFAPGVEAPAPDEAVYDVSCSAAGDCTAVGYFLAAASEYSGEGFAWTQADGVWGQGAPARFDDGLRGALHDDSLSAVSCPSAGGCTAVGLFLDAAGGYQAFAQSMGSGPVITAPSAPGAAAARADAGQVTVSWTAPESDGGAPITSYMVTGSPGGASCTWTAGPLSCTVPGLTNGVAYTFTVVAVNSAGSSSPSAASNAVTPQAESAALSTGAAAQSPVSATVRMPYSPAPGITLGATRGAVTLAASARAMCRDLVRGANIWVRSTSRVACLRPSLPAALSLRNGLVQAATPGAYPITVRIKRANGTQVTRTITVTVR